MAKCQKNVKSFFRQLSPNSFDILYPALPGCARTHADARTYVVAWTHARTYACTFARMRTSSCLPRYLLMALRRSSMAAPGPEIELICSGPFYVLLSFPGFPLHRLAMGSCRFPAALPPASWHPLQGVPLSCFPSSAPACRPLVGSSLSVWPVKAGAFSGH